VAQEEIGDAEYPHETDANEDRNGERTEQEFAHLALLSGQRRP
jgi:hypothetical protein